MKRKNLTGYESGWTLMELMIVVAILSIVSLTLGNMLIGITRFQRQVSAKSDIQRNARTAMEIIHKKLSETKGRTITIDRLSSSQPFYSRLSATDAEGKQFSFYQQGTKLYLQTLTGGTTNQSRLADNVRQVLFSYPISDNGSLISVGLTFEKATYEGASKTLQLSLEKVRIQNPNAQ